MLSAMGRVPPGVPLVGRQLGFAAVSGIANGRRCVVKQGCLRIKAVKRYNSIACSGSGILGSGGQGDAGSRPAFTSGDGHLALDPQPGQPQPQQHQQEELLQAKNWMRNVGRMLGAALLLAGGLLSAASPARARVPVESSSTSRTYCAEPAGCGSWQAGDAAAPQHSGRWVDTGMQLADASEPATTSASGTVTEEKPAKKSRRSAAEAPSTVYDPTEVPPPGAPELKAFTTQWRVDKYKEMTYTQFWNLIGERQIDTVEYTNDKRSVVVTTKETAPGGRRTEKVGLPFDPELYDHMIVHGVYVKTPKATPLYDIAAAAVRLAFPIWFAWLLVKTAFRLGRKGKRDNLFGGIQMERVDAGRTGTTFADVAGIDQVKEEIMEIVTFLRAPQRFLEMGARSPAGVLLVGPPGTGKTLMAKAIAGEAGVPFFSVAGTEFMEMFVGVGAARVRDMFEKARKAAPCILFIDEFDGLGKARSYSGMGDDESVHTINQLLTEMDGFEDNTGVVVMAATNRPAALDEALIRPGRFDRIVHLPLPNLQGRIGILAVHSRDKKLSPTIDMNKVARATAGFTGAELMNLMNMSAIVSVRQGHDDISEGDIFDALEKIHREKFGQGGTMSQYEEDIVPPLMRKSIAVYEAGKALIGYTTPLYDEIGKVVVCPSGLPTGYTYFIPTEEHLESRVVTRGFMEAKMVVGMAGRCAEKLVLGDANVSTAGASDLELVNNVAREMVYRCGFSKKLGPVSLMDNEEVYINKQRRRAVADIGTELARIALSEIRELIEGAEAKAYYGLAVNYAALEALYSALLEKETLSGAEVASICEAAGVHHFPDPFVDGFGWTPSGALSYPGSEAQEAPERELVGAGENGVTNGAKAQGQKAAPKWHPLNPYQVRFDIPDLMADSF